MNKIKEVTFLGFFYDYNKLEVDSLKNVYKVNHLTFSSFLHQLFNLLLTRFDFLTGIFYRSLVFFILNKYKDTDLFVVSEHLHPDFLIAFSECKINKVLIFRNVINENKVNIMNSYKCYTFDHYDSVKYNINMHNQLASGYHYIKEAEFKNLHDISFVGSPKGRSELISKITNTLSGFDVNSKIIEDQSFTSHLLSKVGLAKKNRLIYIDYLKYQLSASVVLDIVQEGQSEVSMRTIEALVAKKKVLTNCKSIFNSELYRENNVFIIHDVDNLKELKDDFSKFIEEPFDDSVNIHLPNYSPIKVWGGIIESSV